MSKKILIVDDNPGDRVLIEEKLLDKGLAKDIETAESGEEAITKAQAIKPDIVILDTRLQAMSGFEACQKIKDIIGDDAHIIMMTGFIDAFDAQKARESGADDYVVKDGTLEDLLEAVETASES